MLDSLPATFDPIRLAEEGTRLSGRLPTRAMRRLGELAQTGQAEAAVDLEFGRNAQGFREMRGRITATVRTVCQRCLGELELELAATPRLMFARPAEGEAGLPEDAELIEVTQPVVLNELVEDELLLAMPMIPMHAEAECRARGYRPVEEAREETGRPNPFAALGELKSGAPKKRPKKKRRDT